MGPDPLIGPQACLLSVSRKTIDLLAALSTHCELEDNWLVGSQPDQVTTLLRSRYVSHTTVAMRNM